MEADPIDGLSRSTRTCGNRNQLWLSWKTWMVLCILSLAGIAGSIAVPVYRHWQAVFYLEEHNAFYGLTDESDWITERFGERARGFRSVEWIELDRVPHDGWKHVAALREVKTVIGSVMHRPFSLPPEGTAALRQLDSLETFQVQNPRLLDEFFAEFFSARPPLVEVDVASSEISRRGLWELSHIATIEDLTLYYNLNISDDDFRDLPPLPELRKASIDTIGDLGLKWLSQSTLLEELSVGNSNASFTEVGLAAIGELKSLTQLRLHGRILEPGGIVHLEQLPRLTSIDVPAECISWETIESFRRMPSLQRVTVWGGISTELESAMQDDWELTVFDWSEWLQASDE